MVKNPPAKEEIRVQFLGQEDPLEKEMATYSGVLAWEIPWTEEPGGLLPMGLQRVKYDLATKQQQQIIIIIKPFWKEHKCKISDFGFNISEMDEITWFMLSNIKTSKANKKTYSVISVG